LASVFTKPFQNGWSAGCFRYVDDALMVAAVRAGRLCPGREPFAVPEWVGRDQAAFIQRPQTVADAAGSSSSQTPVGCPAGPGGGVHNWLELGRGAK
jgi:hypothetical protein